jgi:hypothetical protein
MPKSPMIRLRHHQQEHSASCLAACVVISHSLRLGSRRPSDLAWFGSPCISAGLAWLRGRGRRRGGRYVRARAVSAFWLQFDGE